MFVLLKLFHSFGVIEGFVCFKFMGLFSFIEIIVSLIIINMGISAMTVTYLLNASIHYKKIMILIGGLRYDKS